MDELLLGIITKIAEEKRRKGIYPDSASFAEISRLLRDEARNALNRLAKAKAVSWYRSINDINFQAEVQKNKAKDKTNYNENKIQEIG